MSRQELEEFIRIIQENEENENEDVTIHNILSLTTLTISNTEVVSIPETLVNLEELDCSDCPLLTKIPETLVNLTLLNCGDCPLLTKIPETLVNLEELDCRSNPRLVGIPETLVNLTTLSCSDCLLLTKIPETLVNLEELSCHSNPRLVEIPKTLVNLTKLHCFSNPLITNIPETLVNLTQLGCSRCPLLASIPETLVNLTRLTCKNCPQLAKIPETLVNLAELYCWDCPLLVVPLEIKEKLRMCEGEACNRAPDDPFSHPQIGKDTGYNNGMAIGEPTAPYQIPMSKRFVQKTQYRKLPLDDEVLRVHLQTEPKPHVVFACPVGHLHSRENCGIPMELKVCNEGDNCPFIVGGTHHFLAPGNYVVYHDGYVHANVWYGNFPVFDYPAYELLVEQYNLAADKVDLPQIVPVAERGFTNIARLSDIPVAEGTECPMCGDELQVGKTYVIPDCGHPICEVCLARIRGGNIANINVGTAENFQRRRCGVCSQRFRFGGAPKKYKLYKDESSCIIC
jgi:hypothetical protein